MPTAKKTSGSGKKRPKPSGGIASKIVPIAELEKKVSLLVYGRSKTGKTRLFSTFPTPSLLIGTENGTKSIADVPGIDFLRLTSSEDLDEAIELAKGGYYETVGLDTAGGLQDLILKEVLGADEIPINRSWGMAERGDWQKMGAQFKERIWRLLALCEQGVCNLCIIAHERNFTSEEKQHELITPTVGASLIPTTAGWLNGECDCICQTFIREETEVQTVEIAGEKMSQNVATGEMEYCLRTGPHPVYVTGFRVLSQVELPDVIVDPNYDKIVELIES